MIELPEAHTLAKQLNHEFTGKVIKKVHKPTNEHRFTWFHGDLEQYDEMLWGRAVEQVEAFGIYVELHFDRGVKLNFNDGVNPKLLRPGESRPQKYQLLLEFTDSSALAFTVAMYGGFACHRGEFDNPYYLKSRQSVPPLGPLFTKEYFLGLFAPVKPAMSAKAFLATEQRIPGVGNGVLQDILLEAGVHPKRKVGDLAEPERERLYRAVVDVLGRMVEAGGRDTEKDLYGNPGGYQTMLSKNTWKNGCPRCGGIIEKQAFLGGAIYFCGTCQPLNS